MASRETGRVEEEKNRMMEKGREAAEATKEKAQQTKDKVSESAQAGQGRAQESKDQTGSYLGEKTEAAKQKAYETAEAARARAEEAKQTAEGVMREKTEAAKQKAAEATEKAKETTQAGKEKTGGLLQQTGEKLREMAQGAAETAKQTIGMATIFFCSQDIELQLTGLQEIAMGGENLKSLITSFTPEGDFLAILSPTRTVKIWNTGNGDLFAEWKELNAVSDITYSCLACSFIGNKRSKKHGTFLLALGTNAGDILAINVLTGERKWIYAGCHPGGTAGLSFANKGRSLYTFGTDGLAFELDSKTGEEVQKFKVSKKPISSFALSNDEKTFAVASTKIRVFSLENIKEIQNGLADLGPVQYIAVSDGAKAIVTSRFSEKQLQVWECDSSSKTIVAGPILSMRHPPLVLECQNSGNNRDGLVILSVSESGIAHVWDLKTLSQEEANPTKIRVKSVEAEANQQKRRSAKKGHIPVIAARLHDSGKDGIVSVHIAYGSTDCPQFNLLDITNIGEDIVITTKDVISETVTSSLQENGDIGIKEKSVMDLQNLELRATNPPTKKEKVSKKRAASDPDLATENMADLGHSEAIDRLHVEDDLNEPTMGEKLAGLNLLDDDKANTLENNGSPTETKPPSADSVHVLLKQALHADDRALLLDCLYTQDEKVIANSTLLLNPSDVLKLLDSLVSMIQSSRGAVLACALPWLRNLLLQQASCIMSQESSLLTLNSLYQLIESRVSTFQSALKLSSCLDYFFVGISDDVTDETSTIKPIVYEDKDESDEEEPEDAMETDEDNEGGVEAINVTNQSIIPTLLDRPLNNPELLNLLLH
ncbi:hypothetical protein NE237_025191 [Protea cynaroides]|uniref:Small-subunit processome Utp12 domain-containing protein n=1 Tax=Protea cynaroides TaxID=273540 RepID=A0A9Q0H2L3_9MAGN|nr:hypothetical protein NE237_025191 [Protea cynaroides]